MAITTFYKTIASSVTVTSGFDLGTRGWKNLSVYIPSFSSGTTVTLYTSTESEGSTVTATTGYSLYKTYNKSTATAQFTTFEIPPATDTISTYELPAGLRYFKFKLQSAQTDASKTFTVIASD